MSAKASQMKTLGGVSPAARGRGVALAFMKRGALREKDRRWLNPILRAYVAGRRADLGGDPTTGQMALIQASAIAQGTLSLLLAELGRKSDSLLVLGKDGLAPHGALKLVPALLAQIRGAEAELGLERKAAPSASLAERMRQIAAGTATEDSPIPAIVVEA
jgi:hypothetical protein